LIIGSALFVILETEPTLSVGRERFFVLAERILTTIFVIEYLARAWVSTENPRYGTGFRGRLRYLVSAPAVIDLLAILPVILMFAGSEVFLLRLVRFARLLRVARLGRFSSATQHIIEAISSRRHELMVSLIVAGLLLVASSTMLYLIEGDVQPEAFGSIPRAMWWSVSALTTVGYGDVCPHTPLGRVFAALTAIIGIGLIAMPTGILAAAFSDAVQRAHSAIPRDQNAAAELKGPTL
jgi:voltage-gated potassium channel